MPEARQRIRNFMGSPSVGVGMTERSAADTDRIFEELKAEHRRALEAGDMEGLQRVQEKLAELRSRGLSEKLS
jgi:hypothetical protein